MEKKTLENPDKSGHDPANELTPKQDQAVIALLNAPSIEAAARIVQVNERTIRRWLKKDDLFQDRLRDLRAEALSGAANKLQSEAFTVVSALHDLNQDKENKVEPGRAALIRTALDFAFRAGAYTDLADRIAEIETSPALKNLDDHKV